MTSPLDSWWVERLLATVVTLPNDTPVGDIEVLTRYTSLSGQKVDMK